MIPNVSTRPADGEERHEERPALSDRERAILRLVVEEFIDEAGPVGSRSLAKESSLDLSAASIRNTMADLEDMGYLDHPYTSAGRVPTRMGYRTFVDELMDTPELTPVERQVLKMRLEQLVSDTDELLRESTRLLSKLSNLLGIALGALLYGVGASRRHYTESTLAGAAVGGVLALLGNLVLSLTGIGVPLIAVGAVGGGLAGLIGHYLGRDLRDGLTREV
ncbi:MAG: hypothetical protein BRD30_04700 [Bacteroidetes bacterium QH_2_63_10]|nr:MAG: hypothetical protein BRD30_04700 [Bacteroidetes bacterium QH_2_63_10]